MKQYTTVNIISYFSITLYSVYLLTLIALEQYIAAGGSCCRLAPPVWSYVTLYSVSKIHKETQTCGVLTRIRKKHHSHSLLSVYFAVAVHAPENHCFLKTEKLRCLRCRSHQH